MRNRFMASILVSTLLLTTLAGCQSKTGGSSQSAAAPSETSSAAENSNFNATGYPIVKDKITLNVLMNIRDDTVVDINSLYGIKKLEEQTNIHAEYEVVKVSNWETKLNLMFASSEYPDVIMSMSSDVNYEEYGVTQKLLLPLDGLITEYMPTYKGRAEAEPEDVLAGLRASDGQMYSVGQMIAQNVNTPAQYFLNKTWMDALNLEMPKTLDELTEILRAFKTKDPNGNGKADEVPYEVMFKDSLYSIKYALPLFGIPATENSYLYLDNDKNVQFIPYQKGFRDALEWLNMLYKEGLVDVEVISQDSNMVESKLAEGNVGFFTAWRLSAKGYSDWAVSNATLMNPVAAEGYDVVLTKYMELANRGAYVTATNQHIPETMRWLDAQLETEMMFDIFAGKEGEGWKYNDSGLIETLDSGTQNTVSQALSVNALFFAPGEYYYGVYQMAPHRLEKIEYSKQYAEGNYIQKYSNGLLGLAPRSADEIARCTLLETDIKNAVDENIATFITKGITDESWDAFIQKFSNMNVDEYVSIYQNALKQLSFE